MSIKKDILNKIIQDAFPKANFTLTDLVGDEDHYSLEITSRKFKGLSKIEQHRMVKRALNFYIGGQLHAITIKTIIPTDSENND